jgi:hypothetical protein
MTPPVTGTVREPREPAPAAPPPARSGALSTDTVLRLLTSLAALVAYFLYRDWAVGQLHRLWTELTGVVVKPATVGVWLVAALLAALIYLWRKTLAKDKRFHAPLLITSILFVADAAFGILLNHHSRLLAALTSGVVTSYSPTFVAILTTIAAEMLLGRFYYGKWPHLASAYVSGISAGILVKSNELWPFVMTGLISITSKYVLRVGDRHIWNPTNFGMTVMLFLATDHIASLSVEAGNEVWAVLVIWVLGGLILWNLKLLHITVAFVATFIPLSFFRAWVTGHDWLTELAPMTSPMFQLFIFFMITDPKTITKKRWSQVLVAVLVGVAETALRLGFRDKYSLYHSLFIVGPIANLAEIAYFRYFATSSSRSPRVAPEAG